MGLSVSQLAGLVSTTLKHNERAKVTDIASDLQEYVVMSKLLPEQRVNFQGGESIEFNVTTSLGTNARNVGLYEVDNVDVDDSHVMGEVPWRFTETSVAYDRREKKINSSKPEQLVDLILLRRAREIGGLAKLMEENFWTGATVSTDTKTPFGLPYWVVATAGKTAIANCGFNGANHSGFSSGAGGISSTTYDNWKNWAGNYTTVNKADCIKKMRKAANQTHFISPIKHPHYEEVPETGWRTSDKYQIYVPETVLSDMEGIGELNNENLGRDLASMDGMMTFRKNPVIWVPYLDDNTDNGTEPIYMINWGVFGIVFLEGEWMRETVGIAPNQHNVVQTHIDLSYNTKCENRRRQAMLSYEA